MSKSSTETGGSEIELSAGVPSGAHKNLNSAKTTVWRKIVAFVDAFDTSSYTPYDRLADRVSRLEQEIERFKRTHVDHAGSVEEANR